MGHRRPPRPPGAAPLRGPFGDAEAAGGRRGITFRLSSQRRARSSFHGSAAPGGVLPRPRAGRRLLGGWAAVCPPRRAPASPAPARGELSCPPASQQRLSCSQRAPPARSPLAAALRSPCALRHAAAASSAAACSAAASSMAASSAWRSASPEQPQQPASQPSPARALLPGSLLGGCGLLGGERPGDLPPRRGLRSRPALAAACCAASRRRVGTSTGAAGAPPLLGACASSAACSAAWGEPGLALLLGLDRPLQIGVQGVQVVLGPPRPLTLASCDPRPPRQSQPGARARSRARSCALQPLAASTTVSGALLLQEPHPEVQRAANSRSRQRQPERR